MIDILDKIKNARILVLGDVMLDRYWWGSVNRISPEAPVPIVQMEKTSLVAGGAANVAVNLVGLGVQTHLIGIKGNDAEGKALDDVLDTTGISEHTIFPLEGRRTSIKTRIVAHSQHVVRIDSETTAPISTEQADDVFAAVEKSLGECNAVIISDYAKGLLTDELLTKTIASARSSGKPVLVDPKGRDFAKYRGATVITPNKREAADAASIDVHAPNAVTEAGRILTDKYDLEALLITEGEDGMTLFERGHAVARLPASALKVFDVTGAGDTVIATFAAAAAAGATLTEAAELANIAAGIVVGTIGTTGITRAMLDEHFDAESRSQHSHA